MAINEIALTRPLTILDDIESNEGSFQYLFPFSHNSLKKSELCCFTSSRLIHVLFFSRSLQDTQLLIMKLNYSKVKFFSVNEKKVEQCLINNAIMPLPILILILSLSVLSIICLTGLIFTLKRLSAYKKLAPYTFGIYR